MLECIEVTDSIIQMSSETIPSQHPVDGPSRHRPFKLQPGLIYLNHASLGPWPNDTVQAIADFSAEVAARGCSDVSIWKRAERDARTACATLINAPSSRDIALLKNTSEALSIVANGIDWQPGDNIVVPSEEFPSNRMMWDQLTRRGVEVRHVDILNATDPEVALLNKVDMQTRLLTVSAVHYATGLRLDLARLGQALRPHPCLYCVDAIQQLGVVPLDVQASNIDVLASGVHKWLLAPEGTAMLYIKAQRRDEIALSQWGWRALARPLEPSPERWQLATDARRFECGSHNTMGLKAATASIRYLMDVGVDAIASEVWQLGEQLLEGLSSIGLEPTTPSSRHQRAGIVSVPVPSPSKVAAALSEQRIIVTCRDGLLRFSPHLHNTSEQMTRVLETLSRLI